MAFVQFSKVSLAFADRDLLKNVNLNLAAGSRAALAGANGSGKTTLLKIIAGIIPPDSGERAVQKGTRISYLPQSGIVHKGRTLREETELAFTEAAAKLKLIDKLGRQLAEISSGDDKNQGSINALLEEHHRLGEEVENSGYYRREAFISVVLRGLGFKADDVSRNTEEFSGGWQMRIALAKALLENPDILLLDEPTNYLDIEARTWLLEWLKSFTGGCLLVSHDRYFLDKCVNEIYEIFQGDCKRYAGNYSAYERTRELELESLVKRHAAQQEEIEKTEALIRRFRYKASKAAFAQDLLKRLEKMERIEIPESLKKIKITFPPAPHSGRIALTLEGIGKSYGTNRVLDNIGFTVEAGEKLLVAGCNGAGKTTLLRILAGEDNSFDGNVKYGSGISYGYFSQDAAESITGSQSILEYLEAEASTHLIPRLRDMLGAFLFRGDDVYKSLSVLSGGEKSRLAMLHMLLKPLNLLILDEPTNHLDLYSKDVLLDCLKTFTGTVIFVSHDRGFMEALSTKTLGLDAGRHRLYYGDYAYYLEQTEKNKPEKNSPPGFAGAPASVKFPPVADNRAANDSKIADNRVEEKKRQALARRHKREEEALLLEMEKLETEKTHWENELNRPEIYSSAEKAREAKQKLDSVLSSLEEKNSAWEKLQP